VEGTAGIESQSEFRRRVTWWSYLFCEGMPCHQQLKRNILLSWKRLW